MDSWLLTVTLVVHVRHHLETEISQNSVLLRLGICHWASLKKPDDTVQRLEHKHIRVMIERGRCDWATMALLPAISLTNFFFFFFFSLGIMGR